MCDTSHNTGAFMLRFPTSRLHCAALSGPPSLRRSPLKQIIPKLKAPLSISITWAFVAMDSVFNLEDWLRHAGLDDGVIANVAAKLREEECASVSALKAANDASLQSIGIKVGSRNLILKACTDLVHAPAAKPGGSSSYRDIPPATSATGSLAPAPSPPHAAGAAAAGSDDPYYVQKRSRESSGPPNASAGSFSYPTFPASRYLRVLRSSNIHNLEFSAQPFACEMVYRFDGKPSRPVDNFCRPPRCIDDDEIECEDTPLADGFYGTVYRALFKDKERL